jgi:hypothetical protein
MESSFDDYAAISKSARNILAAEAAQLAPDVAGESHFDESYVYLVNPNGAIRID